MIEKPFDNVEKADIDELVENEIRESRTLDYKQHLPDLRNNDQKKEFLRDVASFANAAGGDIIFGIADTRIDGKPTGLPARASGLSISNIEAEILRLEQTIRTGIEPRIPGVRIRDIPGFENGPVIVIRIPRSWIAPHIAKVGWRPVIYSRTGSGKCELDFAETKTAILGSEEMPQRVRGFRDERLSRIVADQGSLQTGDVSRLVLHLVPINSVTNAAPIFPAKIKERIDALAPPAMGSCVYAISRPNLDGLVSFVSQDGGPTPSSAYVQVFRSGAIEVVDTTLLLSEQGEDRIDLRALELHVCEDLRLYLDAVKQLGFDPPVFIFLSLIQVKGMMPQSLRFDYKGSVFPIDRDIFVLPEVVADDFDSPTDTLMRPIFDALWNACGVYGSPNYDNNGRLRNFGK